MLNEKGFIQLYIGSGKGKTTAAVGLAVRMLGVGGNVLFIQFLKGRSSGEIPMLEQLGAAAVRTPASPPFWNRMNAEEQEICQSENTACFQQALDAFESGHYDLVVLDEVIDAVNHGIICGETLCHALAHRHPGIEVVLTGRNPSPQLMDIADYISEMNCLRHPYQTKGQTARPGIEY